ncbi:MAG: PEP-CTERM sorting domain-containing protein [Fimbriimonadaceae bacterium]|nr:MAG: PEP-CTERM sorting domain-containing protein [Fimbriimonadaceae bacterium]
MKKIAFLFCATLATGGAFAATFSVQFDDPGSTQSAYYSALTSVIQASGQDWASRFVTDPGNPNITVKVSFANIPTANGASATTAFVGSSGGFNIFDQGAAHKLKTGIDMNGADADINFTVGTNYLANELWFDPNYALRTALIPSMKIDAYSIFLHEFGHAFIFNGWRNGTTGSLPGNYMSTFDQHVTSSGGYLYFNGANATAAYGGAVPLTLGNYGHYGNTAPGPGSSLVGFSLMNGVATYYQNRWHIGDLDLGFAYDVGFQAVPEPATLTVLAIAYGLALRRKRK